MKDNDLIKSLNVCQNEKSGCSGCSYSDDYTNCNTRIAKDALELIYRQKAEIERLNSLVDDYFWDFCSISGCEGVSNDCWKTCPDSRYNKTKSEAIKEFAERLKAIYDDKRYDKPNAHTLILFLFNNIDRLVKEMLGDAIVKEMPTDSE